MERSTPNYKRIFEDIISRKCPEKYSLCEHILNKDEITAMDVLKLNDIVFDKNGSTGNTNQKHKSYDNETIHKVLDYQQENNLSNVAVSKHFNVSRSTISKWKKSFSSAQRNNFL